jgi:hypothetical protein
MEENIMKNEKLMEMFNTEDPAGMIPERELTGLTDATDVAGATWVETIIAVSVVLCPTTKCTSACNS